MIRVSSKQSIFFSVPTETNRNSICFACFSVCFAKPKNIFFGLFRFVSVFRTSIETTKTNRIFSKQTKKISKKVLYEGVLETVIFFFSIRTETNRNSIFFGCFSVCFFAKPRNFFSVCFGLFQCFGPVSKQQKQTELMVWGIKRWIFYQICCCFGWSFVCFGCFETPKLPVLILKRNNQNKRLVSDSAETSFGSSFGCFDTRTPYP
jgi:hypothetical protein